MTVDALDFIVLALALLELGLKDTLLCVVCVILWRL